MVDNGDLGGFSVHDIFQIPTLVPLTGVVKGIKVGRRTKGKTDKPGEGSDFRPSFMYIGAEGSQRTT